MLNLQKINSQKIKKKIKKKKQKKIINLMKKKF